MNIKRKKIISSLTAIVSLIIFIISFKTLNKSLAEEEKYYLNAILYNTAQYASGGTGTKLTESGITISNWDFNTSKYLQIDPKVPADGNIYKVQIILPQEMYIVGTELTAPAGYSNVEFVKNEAISVNGGEGTYNLKDKSGTATYTLNYMAESGSIQLELRYDTTLWDEQKNSPITTNDVSPIIVKLIKDEAGTETEIKKVSVSKITSGKELPKSQSFYYSATGITSTSGPVELLIGNRITSTYSYAVNDLYANENNFFSELRFSIKLPTCTYNGKNYYLDIDPDTIAMNSMKTKTYNYSIDNSQEGVTDIILENAYFGRSGILLIYKFEDLPDELKEKDKSDFPMLFSNGKLTIYGNGKNGNNDIELRSVNLYNVTYSKEPESKIAISNSNRNISIVDRPIDTENEFGGAVYGLGGARIANSGTGDSDSKKFRYEFDSENTGKIKVTTVNVHADLVSPNIMIKYTLVDDDGKRVYLDTEGNRVTEETEGAIGEWEYSLNNTYNGKTNIDNLSNKFMRSMLPETQQKYYFKTIEYTLAQIKAKARLFSPTGGDGLTSAGNFFGYVSDDVTTSIEVLSKFYMISADSDVIEDSKEIKAITVTTNSTAFGVSNVTINKTSMFAGENCIIAGRITSSSYPYGTGGWLTGIRLGLLLPQGVTINSDSISIKTYKNVPISDIEFTSREVENGKILWLIKLPEDFYIGYAKEDMTALANGDYISFSMQLNTSYTMNTTTVFARDTLFAAGYNQINAAGGAWNWASAVDTYDLNENGSKTDRIAGVNSTNNPSCQIISQNALLDVTDSIAVTSNNETGSEGSEVDLNTKDDIVTYNLKINSASGGQVQEFAYYIPIPKQDTVIDRFLIDKGGEEDGFEFALIGNATTVGKDLFTIGYSFEKNLTYSTAQNVTTWYTKEDIEADSTLKWEDVTMIKLISKTSVIENGDYATVSLKMKYNGQFFGEEAGMTNIWHSGGYYIHINGNRETAGNYATQGCTAIIKYNAGNMSEDITLTASKTGIPQIEGNVNERKVGPNIFPNFRRAHTFSIEKIETYNVILQTKNYINSNQDMAAIDANKTFGITVSINGKPEIDIVNNNLNEEIGTTIINQAPYFNFKIYNAEKLTDNSTSRYIIVTLKSDNGAIYTQKIIINREIEKASDPKLAIVSGKNYITFDENAQTVTISQDSSFTAQFVTKYVPAIYNTHILEFSKALPSGSTVTLLNLTNENEPLYYYYISDGITTSIDFSKFLKMGTTETKNYEYYTDESEVEEKLLVIVDFENANSMIQTGTYTLKMRIESSIFDDSVSDPLTFITTLKRNFSINGADTTNFEEDYNLDYAISNQVGAESKYEGRKTAIVITMPTDTPIDTKLIINNSEYYLNKDKQFIIDLGDVEEKEQTVTMKFVSNILPDIEKNYLCNIAFWVSATANNLNPMMGEKIVEKNLVLKNLAKTKTALKVTDMSSRIIHVNELTNDVNITFNYLKANNCTLTIELMQKIGSGYQRVTDKINKVGNNTAHNMGVFTIQNPINGANTISLKLSNSTNIGTYRLMFRVNDENGNELLSVPYNFLVVE